MSDLEQLTFRLNNYQYPFYLKAEKILIIGFGNEYLNVKRGNLASKVTIVDKEYFDLSDYKNIQYFRSDVENGFSFITSYFDLIIVNFLIEYIKDKRLFFENIYGLLNKEGCILLSLWFHGRNLDDKFKKKLTTYFSSYNLKISNFKVILSNNNTYKVLLLELQKG